MYHIVKTKLKSGSKPEYYVVLVSNNGEVLSQTETFTRKDKCFKNISSQVKQLGGAHTLVQDDSAVRLIVYKVFADGDKSSTENPTVNVYIPGKNPKKKKQ